MNLHEYQGKQLFAEYGLPVSEGYAVDSAKEAVDAASKIGGDIWVVKAQVHAGGRGKAGGVVLAKTKQEVEDFAHKWLGKNLVTYQTDAAGQPVSKILVESCTDIDQELYLGAVVDRSSQRIVFMASTEGGVEIEKVAHDTPEKILKICLIRAESSLLGSVWKATRSSSLGKFFRAWRSYLLRKTLRYWR